MSSSRLYRSAVVLVEGCVVGVVALIVLAILGAIGAVRWTLDRLADAWADNK